MLGLIVVFKSSDDAVDLRLQPVLWLFNLLGPKKKKKLSVFDEELTNTSRKALKQYRAG